MLQVIPSGSIVLSASAKPRAGWYGVTWEGTTGWVDGQFVSRPTPAAADDNPATTNYAREHVYEIVSKRLHGGGSARDILDPGLTTAELVNAIGWLASNGAPDWGFSVINTGHHDDPEAHTGGFAIDLFANDAADDDRFVALINNDPYFVEVGLAGDYAAHRDGITSAGKCAFVESAATHVHASVRRAFCE